VGGQSHDVVNRWRKLAGTKRVGHLGTLDPMATGLLGWSAAGDRDWPVLRNAGKTYLAEIALGLVSDTYDAEGVSPRPARVPPDAAIAEALEQFTGRFWQTPPAVSAKKIGGVPAYKLARKQIPVELKAVEVEVTRLEVRGISHGKISALIACSSGTYIEALRTISGSAWMRALLSALRRTQIGEFNLEQARTLEELAELARGGRLAEALILPPNC